MKKVIITLAILVIVAGIFFYPKTKIGLSRCAEPAPCVPVKPICFGFIEEFMAKDSDQLNYRCYGIFSRS